MKGNLLETSYLTCVRGSLNIEYVLLMCGRYDGQEFFKPHLVYCLMRFIKITTQDKNINLDDVPEEQQFIVKIAEQMANDKAELEHLYNIGCKAAEEFKATNIDKKMESKLVFFIRQRMLDEMTDKNNSPTI